MGELSLMQRLTRWMVGKFFPNYHLHKNPRKVVPFKKEA